MKKLQPHLPYILIGLILGGMLWEILERLFFRPSGINLSLGPFFIDWGFLRYSLLVNPGSLILAVLYPILVNRYVHPPSKRKPPQKTPSGEFRLRG
jgi:hypothetical protein